jgi:hypothetical protein
MRALLVGLLGLLAGGCASAPADKLSWREAWNLVVMDQSGLAIDAQLSQSNTGLLRGQGHITMTVFPPRESAVVLRRTAPPQAVRFAPEDGTLRLAHDHLVRSGDGWTLHVREGQEALDATIHLTPRAPELPPTTLVEGQRQWLLGAPVPHGQVTGAWRAGQQGGLIRGYGVLVRQSTDTWPGAEPSRSSVYLITPQQCIGVEQVGDSSLAWVASPEGVRSGSSAKVQLRGRKLVINLEPDLPVSATVRIGPRSVSREPWDHLLPGEGLLARLLAGWPQRTHQRGLAQIVVDGDAVTTTALLVHGRPPPTMRRRSAAKVEE